MFYKAFDFCVSRFAFVLLSLRLRPIALAIADWHISLIIRRTERQIYRETGELVRIAAVKAAPGTVRVPGPGGAQ